MNRQDKEDFQQDFAVCMLKGKYNPTEVNSYKDFYVRSRALALAIKTARRGKLTPALKYHTEIMAYDDAKTESTIFEMLESLNFIPSKERVVLMEFLKHGCLVKTAAALSKNYNTTKTYFRQGVISLKIAMGQI